LLGERFISFAGENFAFNCSLGLRPLVAAVEARRTCDHPVNPAGSVRATKDMAVTRKRLSTMSIWLGLFAMLMIHAGPLFSAIQAAQAGVQHHHHAEHQPSAHDLGQRHHAQGHHGQPRTGEPAWLTALELCGYCELLTVNPPLSLALQLVLPRHEADHLQPLPEQPLPPALRRSSGHPRAPPLLHS